MKAFCGSAASCHAEKLVAFSAVPVPDPKAKSRRIGWLVICIDMKFRSFHGYEVDTE
jgi:hypothetical protein